MSLDDPRIQALALILATNARAPTHHGVSAGLMKDRGLTGRASENFAGPVDFETRASESLKNVLANLAVVFQNLQAQQNFHGPRPVRPWSVISPESAIGRSSGVKRHSLGRGDVLSAV